MIPPNYHLLEPNYPLGEAGPREDRMARRESTDRADNSLRLFDHIVVPVEGTDREFLAQQWAAELASWTGTPIKAVHVSLIGGPAPGDLFTYLAREAAKWGIDLATVVVDGRDVAEELLNELGLRDLVVIGTRRLSKHFHVGSVALELVARAPCPVQIVRLE